MVPVDRPSLDELAQAAASAIQSLESHLAGLAVDVEQIRHQVDTSRARVQREREERDIEYSLETGSQYVVESPGTRELRELESELTRRAIRADSLHRQVVEFAALVGAAGRRFAADGELPGADAAEQAAIRSAAVEAQENERHRLAREIHDGPAQALANAIIALEFVERAIRSTGEGVNNRAQDEVERVKTTLREGLTEIRRFIFDLRPTMLQDRGLVATVEHYIATYQSLFPMAINVHADPSLQRLTAEHELAAFRVIQEAIQNARKHARATRVEVTITLQPDVLLVSVEDNGRGFSPERVTTHLMGGVGLRGMQERAELVGGQIYIESAPGEGTRVELHVPLANGSATSTPQPAAAEEHSDEESSVPLHPLNESPVSRPA